MKSVKTEATKNEGSDFYFWLGEDAELIPVTESEFNERRNDAHERNRKLAEQGLA